MRGQALESPPTSVEAGADLFSRIAGALIGAASADALGWITEFVRGPEHLRKLYGTDRVTRYRPWQKTSGGRFNAYIDHINRGEYSDDTQLTLAIARSLLGNGQVDLKHFSKVELTLWLDYARGAGSTIMAAARAMQRKSAAWNRNFFGYGHRGQSSSYRNAGANGAAMRIGPIALANLGDSDTAALGAWQTSIVSHGHPRAILGALLYAEALRLCASADRPTTPRAILDPLDLYVRRVSVPSDPGIGEWMDLWNKGASLPFEEVWEATRIETIAGLTRAAEARSSSSLPRVMKELGCFDKQTKGSGVGTVLAGLLIFSNLGEDFREAVIWAINQLGSDTDTIGGFVGGLCGAFHGYEQVPHEWASELQDYDYFMRVATEISRIATGVGLGGKALLPHPSGEVAALPNLLELLRKKEISSHERVYHPLFGSGWIESVDAQSLRRKDGAQAVFARVAFDIGQSCKFRFISIPRRRGAVNRGPGTAPAAPDQTIIFGGEGT